MDYTEITVFTTTEASEIVAEVMTELGSEGVSIYDGADFGNLRESGVIWDYVDDGVIDTSGVVRVCGYFPLAVSDEVKAALGLKLDDIKSRGEIDMGSLEMTEREVEDGNWNEVWRTFYKPIECGAIAIVPEWIDYTPREGVQVVTMDPGMAFGTGEHETTRLCLKLMQKHSLSGARVADLGTGSGILAIAASKLGAAEVDACDLDEQAVQTAARNCAFNSVGNVTIKCADLLNALDGKYDLIVANITADVLCRLAATVRPFVADGASVIVSGIILARIDDVARAFEDAGFTVVDKLVDGEWCGMELKVR